ncbi:Hypothetical predicted protein [Cloeon dipterum]|nr:Hypothetical predicted protein [Cloeon dipterum]
MRERRNGGQVSGRSIDENDKISAFFSAANKEAYRKKKAEEREKFQAEIAAANQEAHELAQKAQKDVLELLSSLVNLSPLKQVHSENNEGDTNEETQAGLAPGTDDSEQPEEESDQNQS